MGHGQALIFFFRINMATIQHKDIPGTHIHEPRNIQTASKGQVYVADGNGSGRWEYPAVGDIEGVDIRSDGQLVVENGLIVPKPFNIFMNAYSEQTINIGKNSTVNIDIQHQDIDFMKGMSLSGNRVRIDQIGVYRITYALTIKGALSAQEVTTIIPGYNIEDGPSWGGATVTNYIPQFSIARGNIQSDIISPKGTERYTTITNDGYATLYGESVIASPIGALIWLSVNGTEDIQVINYNLVIEYMGEV